MVVVSRVDGLHAMTVKGSDFRIAGQRELGYRSNSSLVWTKWGRGEGKGGEEKELKDRAVSQGKIGIIAQLECHRVWTKRTAVEKLGERIVMEFSESVHLLRNSHLSGTNL